MASSSGIVLAIPFAMLGVAATVIGVLVLMPRIRALLGGSNFDAVVVDRDVHRVPVAERRAPGSLGGATVTPYLRYRTAEGEEKTARLDHQQRQRLHSERYRLRYPIGARVRILVDPRRPELAYDRTIWGMVLFGGLLAVAGLLVCLIALGLTFG
jgi:hypothetical protein